MEKLRNGEMLTIGSLTQHPTGFLGMIARPLDDIAGVRDEIPSLSDCRIGNGAHEARLHVVLPGSLTDFRIDLVMQREQVGARDQVLLRFLNFYRALAYPIHPPGGGISGQAADWNRG